MRSGGGQVRLGFEADKATAVLRDNAKNPLYEKKVITE
jgi:sRNA-binding carbon storage regulator CsrA